MVLQNNALLRQIANRGRSFYLESVHDGERRANVAGSLEATNLSIFDTSSSVDDRQFDFDDEIINAGAYRRALASLRRKDRFEEEMSNNLPTEDVDKALVSTTLTNESNESTQADTNDFHQKIPFPGGEETILATSGTYEIETVINQLQDMQGDYMKTFDQYEPMFSNVAKVPGPLLDPRTGQPHKETSGPLEMSNAQMVVPEKKAAISQGELPAGGSRVAPPSRLEIQTEKEHLEGQFGISDAGRSQNTPEKLKKRPGKSRDLKVVLVGDGTCGKTYAAMKYVRGHTDGIPYFTRVWENYDADIEIDGYLYQVRWQDTPGVTDYDSLRPLAYPNCDVALLCFAIDDPWSLENIQTKWVSEIYHFLPDIPKILVGCKADLRDDPETIKELAKTLEKPVSRQRGEQVAHIINRRYSSPRYFQPQVKYMECSSFTGDGITELFEEAARLGLQYSIKQDEMKPRGISGLFRRRRKVGAVASIPEDPGSLATET